MSRTPPQAPPTIQVFLAGLQVFKEEEEAIKVDLHEGCGRTKLFWLMALADSKTMKAMVEFREHTGEQASVRVDR